MGQFDELERRSVATLTRIELPTIPRASAEEIERRRTLFAQAMALRDEIGPIGLSAADLVRQSRDESDGA
ncbi:MAG TPA: hypothetical protein VH482_03245 [Thermomicrobiales bacterium]|jgi:hypothetical protein